MERFENGNSIIFNFRRTMYYLKFFEVDPRGNPFQYYHGLKEYWGYKACQRQYRAGKR